MSETVDTFRRVEDKYCLNRKQAEEFLEAAKPHLKEDVYFRYHCRSIYFDNDSWQLVYQSLAHPVFKTKVRMRTYSDPKEDTPVFLETKKKYGNIVYKKRIQLTDKEADDYLDHHRMHSVHNNTAGEIDYLLHYYGLKRRYISAMTGCVLFRQPSLIPALLLTAISSSVHTTSLCMNTDRKRNWTVRTSSWSARSATAIRCG